MILRLIGLTALAILGVTICAQGARTTVDVAEVAVLTPPGESGEMPRYLISFEIPEVLDGVAIDFARVRMRAEVTSPGGVSLPPLVIEAYPVTTPWEAESVGWSTGWETAGGDFDEHGCATYVGDASQMVSVSLDLTHVVQRWVSDETENYGVIILLPAVCGHAITMVDQQSNPPVLEVYWSAGR